MKKTLRSFFTLLLFASISNTGQADCCMTAHNPDGKCVFIGLCNCYVCTTIGVTTRDCCINGNQPPQL